MIQEIKKQRTLFAIVGEEEKVRVLMEMSNLSI